MGAALSASGNSAPSEDSVSSDGFSVSGVSSPSSVMFSSSPGNSVSAAMTLDGCIKAISTAIIKDKSRIFRPVCTLFLIRLKSFQYKHLFNLCIRLRSLRILSKCIIVLRIMSTPNIRPRRISRRLP